MQTRIFSISHNRAEFRISSKFRRGGDDLLFFIHGLGCAKENFDGVWEFRKLGSRSALAIDLPGFGDSRVSGSFSYDLYDHAAICRAVLSEFPDVRIHIVGHSMGGAVGVLLAEMIGERLGSFINVEGNLISHDSTVSRSIRETTFAHFKKYHLPGLIASSAVSDEPGRRLWATLIPRADTYGLYMSSRSLAGWSDSGALLEKFRKLECNKLYIYGEINSFLAAEEMLRDIPKAGISNSGHFPMNDNPGEFYRVLADFLESDRPVIRRQ